MPPKPYDSPGFRSLFIWRYLPQSRSLRIALVFFLFLFTLLALLKVQSQFKAIDPVRLLHCTSMQQRLAITPSRPSNCCPKLDNDIYIRQTVPLTYLSILHHHSDLCNGGWEPRRCLSQQHVAVIIPYRDREANLMLLLDRLHTMLQKQLLVYRIYVVEQAGPAAFNRGLLLNVGMKEALRHDPSIDCFIFHDVDLLPENSANLYLCDNTLRHLAAAIDEFRFHPPFANNAGGVSALSKSNAFRINGFPNRYWGWGNEDDELAARCQVHNIPLSRPAWYIGRYRALRHRKSSRGSGHYDSFRRFRGYHNDGLTRLTNSSYIIQSDTFSSQLEAVGEQFLTERNIISALNSSSKCARDTLAYLLHKNESADVKIKLNGDELDDLAAKLTLFRHLIILPLPTLLEPIKPAQETKESMLWFLHFYGWI